jgi:hypothetical protein
LDVRYRQPRVILEEFVGEHDPAVFRGCPEDLRRSIDLRLQKTLPIVGIAKLDHNFVNHVRPPCPKQFPLKGRIM